MATRAIHAGEPRQKYADSLMTPIVQTSTFTFKNSKAIEDYTKKGKAALRIRPIRQPDRQNRRAATGRPRRRRGLRRLFFRDERNHHHHFVACSFGRPHRHHRRQLQKDAGVLQVISQAVRDRLHDCAFRRLRHYRQGHQKKHPLHFFRIAHQSVSEYLRPCENQKNRRQAQNPYAHRLDLRHALQPEAHRVRYGLGPAKLHQILSGPQRYSGRRGFGQSRSLSKKSATCTNQWAAPSTRTAAICFCAG